MITIISNTKYIKYVIQIKIPVGAQKITPRIISANIEILLYDNHDSEFDIEFEGIIERNYKRHDDIYYYFRFIE